MEVNILFKIFTVTNNGGASKSEGHSFELGIQNFSNEKSFTVSMISIDGSINTAQITGIPAFELPTVALLTLNQRHFKVFG